jgi:hypothetical protein
LNSSSISRFDKPENGLDSYQTSRAKAARFGNDQGGPWESLKKIAKTTTAIAGATLSGVGLAIGIPLGLLQMAVGIFFHPLLITGALTIGIPLAGLIGSIMLGKK